MSYSIDLLSSGAKLAYESALKTSTKFGQETGWIRLARMLSMDDNRSQDGTTYIISCRKVHGGEKMQFGCGCPDWVYRKQHTGDLCKHQVAFLTQPVRRSFEMWYYAAGKAFLNSTSQGKTDEARSLPLIEGPSKKRSRF